jgi:competence protein ComEC
MKFWNSYPLFRFLLPFVAGIIITIKFQLFLNPYLLFLLIILLILLTILSNRFQKYSFRWIFGSLLYLLIFVCGVASTILHTPKYHENHFPKLQKPGDVFIVRLTETPSEKPNSLRAFANVEYLKDSSAMKNAGGKIMLYFETDSLAKSLKYGDYILFSGNPNEISPPANPHQFNYRNYLSNDGIYHQIYLRSNDWIKTAKNDANPVFKFSELARLKMLKILEINGLAGDEYAVASALLLGYTENLEPELRNQYAGAGALHILSVSGLHVGIIFVIVGFMLKFFDKIRNGRIYKFTILLLVIWLYAFITGLSPSVLRATVMFSLFAIKEVRKQQSDPYNTLAASALLLIISDPFIITKVGFQLSYAAVLGIIALYKPIYELWILKNKAGDYIWQIISVSLAAQIGTFPISVMYFHQFPSYFLPANLFVIPLSWLIMVAGIAVLFFFFWPWMAGILGILLKNLVFALNYSVGFVDGLPGAKIEGMVYYLPQVVLIYLIFIFITRSIIMKRASLVVATLVGLVLLTGSFIYERSKILKQKQLVIYSMRDQTAIDVFMGDKGYALADSAVFSDKKSIGFNLKNSRIFAGIRQMNNLVIEDLSGKPNETLNEDFTIRNSHFMKLGKYRLALIDDDFDEYFPEIPLKVDYLILKGNPKISISALKEKFDFDKLIFDGSNKFYSTNRWKEECEKLAIPFHDVKKDGAFTANL